MAVVDRPPDLVDRLCEAAVSVIRNERPTLKREPSQIRSVVIELSLDSRGQLADADVYTQRRLTVSQALGLPRNGRVR